MQPLSNEVNVLLREGNEDDYAFVYATWLKGLRHGNDWFEAIDADCYFNKYKEVVRHLLHTSKLVVACLSDEPDVVLGYVVTRGPVLHWVFVKKAWRKLGIGKRLIPQGIDTVSHLTKVGRAILPKEWKFNPFTI